MHMTRGEFEKLFNSIVKDKNLADMGRISETLSASVDNSRNPDGSITNEQLCYAVHAAAVASSLDIAMNVMYAALEALGVFENISVKN